MHEPQPLRTRERVRRRDRADRLVQRAVGPSSDRGGGHPGGMRGHRGSPGLARRGHRRRAGRGARGDFAVHPILRGRVRLSAGLPAVRRGHAGQSRGTSSAASVDLVAGDARGAGEHLRRRRRALDRRPAPGHRTSPGLGPGFRRLDQPDRSHRGPRRRAPGAAIRHPARGAAGRSPVQRWRRHRDLRGDAGHRRRGRPAEPGGRRGPGPVEGGRRSAGSRLDLRRAGCA